MSLQTIFFGDDHGELKPADAVRIAFQSIAIGLLLALAFGPFDFSIWGLMAKAAATFGALP